MNGLGSALRRPAAMPALGRDAAGSALPARRQSCVRVVSNFARIFCGDRVQELRLA